jgi:threonine dehydrogenase-like Zn-dependent dehydrogenase
VVEATGSAKGLALASELAAPDGTLVVLGYHASGPRNLDLSLWYRSVTIVNGYSDNRARRLDAMSRGLGLIAQRRITFAPLVTHRFSLDEVDAAFRLFEDRPAGFLKAVIVP